MSLPPWAETKLFKDNYIITIIHTINDGNPIKTTAADAPASCITRQSAVMVLTMQDKQASPSQNLNYLTYLNEIVVNVNFRKINSPQQELRPIY